LKIEILGTGCPKCDQLFQNVRQALQELDVEAEVVKVTDIHEMMRHGPIMTPGLVVNGKLRSSGKVLDIPQMKELFLKEEVE
jgi:small redox-active disulfide protein 2